MSDDTLGSLEVAEQAGLSYRQLDYWVHKGYLVPVGEEHPGSGSGRRFQPEEAEVAKHMAALCRAGVLAVKAEPAARELTTSGVARLGGFTITPGEQIGI